MNDISIKLYDHSTIHTLSWPQTAEAELAKKHLLPLIEKGPETFIENAKTALYLLTLGDLIVPISVNDTEYTNCYLLSSYFIVMNLKEKLENSPSWLRFLTDPLVSAFGAFLKWVKINKVVIINNWLFSTNLYPDLTEKQIGEITSFLKARFPDHYFMFRSVNTYKSTQTYDSLHLEQYRMIPCRQVYLYDPATHPTSDIHVLRKQKKDTNRISSRQYEVEVVEELKPEESERCLELYRNVYVGKYTKYSPLYTEEFLRSALKNKTIKLKLLKKNGTIYGVTGFLQKNNYLLVPFFGYDTSVPQDEGLYRMLSSVILSEIENAQLISHQGSGAGQFKKWRGFSQHLEYVGIYDRHLPFFRRLFWTLSEKFSPLFLRPNKH